MHSTRHLALFAALVLAAPVAAAAADRVVFVTVIDGNGAPVPDLTPADFTVKEGGKEREVTKAAPASARMRLTLAVEERMIADTSVRMALFEFMKRTAESADIRMVTIGLRNTTVVDYTSSLDALVGALNKFTLNPNRDSNVAEGVLEIADHYASTKPERPVLVVLAMSGGQAGVQPRTVLEKLRQSAAIMYSVTLAGGSEGGGGVGSLADQSGREQVLGDGPKQSGGRRIEVPSTGAFPRALQQIADELRAQYAITYALPEGVKPDKRFNISAKRKGITLRAPSGIPDR
jgi:Ca-activated chloride channel homolog